MKTRFAILLALVIGVSWATTAAIDANVSQLANDVPPRPYSIMVESE